MKNKIVCTLILSIMAINAEHQHHKESHAPIKLTPVQQQFQQLQESVGIHKYPHPHMMGKPTPQNQPRHQILKKARMELNNLLAQPMLDVPTIEQKIKEFEALKPMHWPQPSDYRDILDVKLGKKTAAQVSVAIPAPAGHGKKKNWHQHHAHAH